MPSPALPLTPVMREHFAAMNARILARGLHSPGEATLRNHGDRVFTLAFAADDKLELRLHVDGARRDVYRRGRALGVSYVGSSQPDMRLVDVICEHLLEIEDALIDGLRRSKASAQLVQHVAPSSEHVDVPIALARRLNAAGLEDARLAHVAEQTFDLSARGAGRTLRVRLRPLLGGRNPFAAGHSISIHLPDVVATGSGAELLGAMTDAVLACEEDLEPLFAGTAHLIRMTLQSGRQKLLPVGRLVRYLDGELRERRGLIYLTSPCYANCTFCGEETTRAYVFSELDAVLRSIRERDFQPERVAIGGFEPLSHPGIPEMIAELRRTRIERVELMTTGVPLGAPRTVDALLDAGLTDVAIPLYGVDEATNDLVMRKSGAFRATLAGLDRLQARGCRIWIHTIVVRQNLHQIDALHALARERWDASFVAAPPRVKHERFAEIAAPMDELARSVTVAPLLGVPFCHVPRMADHPDVRVDAPLQLTLGSIADSMRFYFSQELVQPAGCATCRHRVACTGVMASQLELEPALEIRPFEK